MDIKKEKKSIKNLKAFLGDDWGLTEEQKDELDDLTTRVLLLGKELAQAAPEWVSVDDELPSEGDLLLGISTTKLAKFNVYQVVALDEFDDCEITHWMHLPQAPKEQDQSHD